VASLHQFAGLRTAGMPDCHSPAAAVF